MHRIICILHHVATINVYYFDVILWLSIIYPNLYVLHCKRTFITMWLCGDSRRINPLFFPCSTKLMLMPHSARIDSKIICYGRSARQRSIVSVNFKNLNEIYRGYMHIYIKKKKDGRKSVFWLHSKQQVILQF
jgi:hypothetical protein